MSGRLTIEITGPAPGPSFTFDVLSVERTPSTIVTEHPVEEGIDVTDHIQRRPDEFVVAAKVTNSPLAAQPAAPGALPPVKEAERFLDAAAQQLLTLTFQGEPSRGPFALEGWPSRKTYEDAVVFRLRLKQIRIARALSVQIPVSTTSSTGAPDAQDMGQQPTAEGPTSIARSVINIFSPQPEP